MSSGPMGGFGRGGSSMMGGGGGGGMMGGGRMMGGGGGGMMGGGGGMMGGGGGGDMMGSGGMMGGGRMGGGMMGGGGGMMGGGGNFGGGSEFFVVFVCVAVGTASLSSSIHKYWSGTVGAVTHRLMPILHGQILLKNILQYRTLLS